MKRAAAPPPDPDDLFAETRMSFGEHIEDLRSHLLRAVYGFLIAFVIAIPFGSPILQFIAAPVEKELDAFDMRYQKAQSAKVQADLASGAYANIPPIQTTVKLDGDELAKFFAKKFNLQIADQGQELGGMMQAIHVLLERLQVAGLVDRENLPDPRYVEFQAQITDPVKIGNELAKLNKIIRPSRLTTFSVQEAFVVLFKVILMAGLVIASPWVFYQIWSFVAAGLYPHEKRLVNVYGPFSIGLFLVGVVVCEFFVIPKAIEAMLWFNELLGFQPDMRLNEWLGFAIFMPIVFGISFQTPLVMLFMAKIGVFNGDSYRSKRRIAWFLMAVFAAVITPSTDAFSMLFLWVPMSMLYELGIWLCRFASHDTDQLDLEGSESEELVEV